MAIRIIDRLRSHLEKHPEGGTVVELTAAIGAEYRARVTTQLHTLWRNSEVVRWRTVKNYAAVYHYRLPTDRLILVLADIGR